MKKVIFIDSNRNGYSPSQCGDTMTIGELKCFLEYCGFDDDTPIYFRNDKGHTYGNIKDSNIYEDELNEEDF